MLEIVVIGAAVFGVVAYALGRIGGLAPVVPDDGDDGLPHGRLEPAAVDRARFGLAFRGYRMGEVDRVLDRLRDELSARDAELAGRDPEEEWPTGALTEDYVSASSLGTGTTAGLAPLEPARPARPRGAHARPAGSVQDERPDANGDGLHADPDHEDES